MWETADGRAIIHISSGIFLSFMSFMLAKISDVAKNISTLNISQTYMKKIYFLATIVSLSGLIGSHIGPCSSNNLALNVISPFC